MNAWKKNPTFVDTLRKLHELSIRAQRIVLITKMRRTQAMITALVPGSQETSRGK
jgi:hypothetical protein